eukprot:724214-Hanusia_phi.AAC.2
MRVLVLVLGLGLGLGLGLVLALYDDYVGDVDEDDDGNGMPLPSCDASRLDATAWHIIIFLEAQNRICTSTGSENGSVEATRRDIALQQLAENQLTLKGSSDL